MSLIQTTKEQAIQAALALLQNKTNPSQADVDAIDDMIDVHANMHVLESLPLTTPPVRMPSLSDLHVKFGDVAENIRRLVVNGR